MLTIHTSCVLGWNLPNIILSTSSSWTPHFLEPCLPQGPDKFELIVILCILPLFTCRLNAWQSKLFTEFPQKVSQNESTWCLLGNAKRLQKIILDFYSKGILRNSPCSLTAGHFVYLRPWQTVWSRKISRTWYFSMYKLCKAERMFPLQMQNNF